MTDKFISNIKDQIDSKVIATIFGSSIIGEEIFTDKYNLNEKKWLSFTSILAENNIPIINGGYQGTMNLIAQKMKADGGKCYGVISSSFDDECTANLYTQFFTVSNAFDRLKTLISVGDFYIFLPGGIGSLVEIVCTLWYIDRKFMKSKNLYFLGPYWKDILSDLCGKSMMFKNGITENSIKLFTNIDLFNEALLQDVKIQKEMK